jgi:excisionase family DNA binding protein
LRTVAQSAQDRLKDERETQFAILAAAIAAAVQAAMENWMHTESPAGQGVLDQSTVQAVQAANSAGSPLLAALPANRVAFRVSQIQEILGIGRDQAYTLVNSGRLRSIRVGTTILVPKSALDEFLAGEQATSPAAGS